MRKLGKFKMTFARAKANALHEIKLMEGKEAVISCNIPPGVEGVSGKIQDPGIAAYFNRADRPICVACDNFLSIEANMQAVNKTLDALRAIERYGGEQLMDVAMTGFAALPDKSNYFADCKTRDQLDARFRELVKRYHPDVHGSGDEYKIIREQYEEKKTYLL